MPKIGSGIEMNNYNTKNIIEDFMKQEYEEGFRNEFSTMDALLNKLPKQQITGKKKYKTFSLGITDNVRTLGRSNDRYQIGFNDFYNKNAGETVDAEFDTTKLLATFSITDEAILKGTGAGSLIDVLKDELDRMEMALKVTMNRFTYGSHEGKIGVLTYFAEQDMSPITENGNRPTWQMPNNSYFADRPAPYVMRMTITNSSCLLPGQGILLAVTDSSDVKQFVASGYIWQKINDSIYQEDLLVFIDKIAAAAGTTATPGAPGSVTGDKLALYKYLSGDSTITAPQTAMTAVDTTNLANKVVVYARQFDEGATTGAVTVNDEYHGLEDIVMTQNNKIFGVDRSVYKALNNTIYRGPTSSSTGATKVTETIEGVSKDFYDYYLGEELLRDMSDNLLLTAPEGTAVSIVAAQHRVISSIEKSMYQFKEYSIDTGSNGYNLGNRADIKWDTFVLHKDKYARSDSGGAYVYLLDQQKIGELVRRDFQWLTDGEVNGILQRRPGTELFEGIMNKYADMYIDAWKCHGAFKNVRVPGIGQAVPTQYAS